jgi:ABC-type Mn2+/Zn2+ transport system permease subunit
LLSRFLVLPPGPLIVLSSIVIFPIAILIRKWSGHR